MEADLPAGVRYAREAGPGDAGFRVSLRHRLAEGGLSDVLGDLVRWSSGTVEVRRADGTCVTLDEGAVVAVRRVPPPPTRRGR